MLRQLAKIAIAENCGRFEWQVLDWNTPAIRFYDALGAKVLEGWLTMRVTGKALRNLAVRGDADNRDSTKRLY